MNHLRRVVSRSMLEASVPIQAIENWLFDHYGDTPFFQLTSQLGQWLIRSADRLVGLHDD